MAQTQLGGKEVNIRGAGSVAQGTIQPVGLKGGSSTDVSGIMKGINNLVSVYTKKKRLERQEQNAEDIMYAKAQAQNDITSAETALSTMNSDREDFNELVKQNRQNGLSDAQISALLYDDILQKSSEEIEGEALEADKTYLTLIGQARTKSNAKYAQEDNKEILQDVQNTIYATSNVKTGEESFQDVFNKNLEVSNTYGIDKQQVVNLTIKRAFDLARAGDRSLLDNLDTIKVEGIKLRDTLEGSKLFVQYSEQLDNKEYRDKQRADTQRKQTYEDNTNNLFLSLYEGEDVFEVEQKALEMFSNDSISLRQYNKVKEFTQAQVEGTYSNKTDPATYASLYGKAIKGILSIDELMSYQSVLTEKDFRKISTEALNKGGLDGIGDVAYKQLVKRINNDANSYTGLDLLGRAMNINTPQIAFKRASYVQQHLRSNVESFIENKGELPTEEEYSKMRDKWVNKAEIELPSSSTSRSQSIDIDELVKKSEEARDLTEFMQGLTSKELDAYIEYEEKRKEKLQQSLSK